MLLNKNIKDLYNITIANDFIRKIYKPSNIDNNKLILNYSIIELNDIPDEIKNLIQNLDIKILLNMKNTELMNNSYNINHSALVYINIQEIQENVLNNFDFNFKTIYTKIDEKTTDLSFNFTYNKDNCNPFYCIIVLILQKYLDEILIPNIQKKFTKKIVNYISC
jgi:hypothetical protein